MQDECKRINGTCAGLAFVTEDCKYKGVCPFQMQSRRALAWDLTEPPRFTEPQMALLKALLAVGVLELDDDSEYDQVIMYTAHGRIGGFRNKGGIELSLKAGETLDLAELFGKDGA